MIGTTVSHYRILEKIGAGGMGEVYLAEDQELKRKVALKFLPAWMSGDPDHRSRFKREAQALAALNHPHIVSVYEVAEAAGQLFIAMEFVSGQSIKQLVKSGDLSLDQAIDLAGQAAGGLAAAHKAGIVHRDIKSDNIVVSDEGQVKIMDFGLATWKGATKLTQTGSTLGTMSYMSPEQAEGRHVDHRADLFSLGVVMYEMLSGRLPFAGEHEAAILYSIANDEPEPLARYKSGVHAELQRIVSKALAKSPDDRYQSAADMATDIRHIVTPPATPAQRTRPQTWRWAGVAVVMALAAAGYWGYRSLVTGGSHRQAQPKRVAVLQFADLNQDKDDFLASGITEDVVSRLTSVNGIAVLSQSTAGKIKASEEDLARAGKRMGADFVLDGSVRKQISQAGDLQLRVVAQLIRTADDVNIWTHTYDTVLSAALTVQSDIAEKVSQHIGILLNPQQREQMWKRWTSSPEAWEYYLRGGKVAWRYSGYGEQSLRAGLELYRKAAEFDSAFALPLASMSQIYSRLYFFGYEKTDSVPQLAWSLAERAARLEPELFAASKAKAEYYYRCRRDYGKSLAEWDKAAQDNKANDLQYLWQTHHILRRAGRFQDAYDRLRRACDLDPADAFKKMDLSATCMAMRRYSEAGQLLNEVILKEPDFENGYEGKAELALYAYGDIAAVREVIHQSEGKVDQSRWDQFASYFDVLEGRYDKALLQVPPIEDDSAAYYRQCARIYDYKSDTLTMRAYADSALPGTERRAAEAPLDPQAQADLGIVYAELGRKADAIAAGKRGLEALTVQDDAIQGPAGIQNLIIIYGLVGEVDSAMAQFEYLMSIPFNFTPAYVVIDPDFAPLTKHPRFATVAARGGKVF